MKILWEGSQLLLVDLGMLSREETLSVLWKQSNRTLKAGMEVREYRKNVLALGAAWAEILRQARFCPHLSSELGMAHTVYLATNCRLCWSENLPFCTMSWKPYGNILQFQDPPLS